MTVLDTWTGKNVIENQQQQIKAFQMCMYTMHENRSNFTMFSRKIQNNHYL